MYVTLHDLVVKLTNDPSSASETETPIPKDLSSTKSIGGGANVPKSADETPGTRSLPSEDYQTKFGLPEQWRSTASFSSDIYLCKEATLYKVAPKPDGLAHPVAYIFWSIFTSLVPTLFYFSVWELAIAGAELALLSTLSPIMLSLPLLFSWARTRGGRTILHLLSFFGLVAYAFDRPIHRLLIVSFATAIVVIRQVVDWTGVDANDSSYQSICTCYFAMPLISQILDHHVVTGLGLILASLSKHANHSNNPGMCV